MRMLVSCKPVDYTLPTHSYGVLAEVDWSDRSLGRVLRIPTATFKTRAAFMAPLASGIAQVGSTAYLAMWNFVAVIDLDSFQVLDSWTHPWMADLHGMTTDGERLWVASTATESILCLDLRTGEVIDRWGPDEPILETPLEGVPYTRRPLSIRVRDSLVTAVSMEPGQMVRRKLPPPEHRYLHKRRSRFWRHHLNDVHLHDGHLYVSTKRWFQKGVSGGIFKIDLDTKETSFVAPPGTFAGLHDAEFVDGKIVVTESLANSVAWVDADGSIHHRTIEPSGYFVRGLCQTGDGGFVVGYTPERGTDVPTWLVEFDGDFEDERARMRLDIYPETHGTAVHTMLRDQRDAPA